MLNKNIGRNNKMVAHMDRFVTGTDIHWTSNRNTESQQRIHINVFTIKKYLFTAPKVPLFRVGLYESSEYI